MHSLLFHFHTWNKMRKLLVKFKNLKARRKLLTQYECFDLPLWIHSGSYRRDSANVSVLLYCNSVTVKHCMSRYDQLFNGPLFRDIHSSLLPLLVTGFCLRSCEPIISLRNHHKKTCALLICLRWGGELRRPMCSEQCVRWRSIVIVFSADGHFIAMHFDVRSVLVGE